MEIAIQAPSGSNAQGWESVFITDSEKKAQIGEHYRQAAAIYSAMPFSIGKQHQDSDDTALKESQARSLSSSDYLVESMSKVPALLIPCIMYRDYTQWKAGRGEQSQSQTRFGELMAKKFTKSKAAGVRYEGVRLKGRNGSY